MQSLLSRKSHKGINLISCTRLQMILGVVLWSSATLAASFMTNYWAFMGLRALTGIGEAMFSVVSPTVISDICTGDTRSNFLIIYYFAIPVGRYINLIILLSIFTIITVLYLLE